MAYVLRLRSLLNNGHKNTVTCILTILTLWFLSTIALAQQYSIAAGNPSGLYYPIGGNLASIWSRTIPDFNMKAEVTDASVANVIQVAIGSSEVGFSQGDVVLDAYQGQGKFSQPLDISVLFAVYPNLVHAITRSNSGIQSISDLKGKVVSVGAPGSGTAITAVNILNQLGVESDSFRIQHLDYIETANAIRDGKIDAGFIVGGIGVAAIVELALTRGIQIINFSNEEMSVIQQTYPAYISFTIDAGVYRGVAHTQVPAVWNVLVVNQSMSDELAYQLTKQTFEHTDELRLSSVAADYITLENAHQLKQIPLHPGAQRYIDEAKAADAIVSHESDKSND